MRRPPPRSASSAALGPPWHHQARAGRHRQRGELPRPELHREHHVPGLTPSEDPPLHPTAQWQGRALQPHPGRGVPLHPHLHLTAAAPRRRRSPHPSASGVLRARIRPATEPTGQVLCDLLGDLGADRGGGGVIEIGAHTPSVDGGSEEPDCPLGTTLKPLFACGAGP